MKGFAYSRATDVDAAIRLIAGNGHAKFLGGGTNLVDLMREEIEQPDPSTFMRARASVPGRSPWRRRSTSSRTRSGWTRSRCACKNEPDRDPTTGAPFSMRSLREAYRVGAENFGWARRRAAPRTTRDGRHLVGYGVATAYYPTNQFPAAARVEIHADGSVIGQSSAQEMGMGTATAQAQNLADQLAIPLERVRSELAIRACPRPRSRAGRARRSASAPPSSPRAMR
jgi:xanthine dehydrogenase YagR molybdenum-binding subunit